MFTGIIQGFGRVGQITPAGGEFKLVIEAEFDWGEPLALGESVCVSGACLTVVKAEGRSFSAHVSAETRQRSIMKHFSQGARVNLERALRLSDRLGGHLVTGHVDGVGVIQSIDRQDSSRVFSVNVDRGLMMFIVAKGSVAVDGISLTVNKVTPEQFTVNVIPSTLAMTTLSSRKAGDQVNIETDLIGKYVARFMNEAAGRPVIDKNFLAAHGFLSD